MRLGNGYLYLTLAAVVHTALAYSHADFQKVPTKVVWAVTGRDVELPCDVTPPLPSDAVSMVFWFKDTTGTPLYSLDARGGALNTASHLTMSDDLGTRSYFITDENPSRARLKIHRVTHEDEGVFRCRVDFTNSPTRNFKVNLTLVVQPSTPKIFDAEGKEVKHEAGPFFEGQPLFLSCQTTGGKPPPRVTWWANDTLLDGVVDTGRSALTAVNQLVIPKAPRSLRGSRLECRASSMEIAGDIVREVPIIIFLKPNKVKIVTPNELLSSSKVETVRCETSGSYPPAKISWSLDGKPIRNQVLTEEETSTSTTSILSLRTTPDDDGKDLVCRASNPRFLGIYTEDRRQIHVAYPPKVVVRLDTGSSPVQEGATVVLRCDCVARPTPHNFNWYHNGYLINYNESAGILPIDDLLTINRIEITSDGDYSCAATNSEGETYSAPLNILVQYAPRCKKGYETMRVGAVPFESMVVHCHVDALPEVTRFHWTYNTSRGVLPIQGGKMQNKIGVSTLHFTPGAMDIDSLQCWATNHVGRQETPCLFYIVQAHVPEPPSDCVIRNATHGGGLEVSCTAGRDGGLRQSFVLEVDNLSGSGDASATVETTLSDQGAENATPLYRVLGETPIFRLHSLQPGHAYQLLVYAVNAKGRSNPPVMLTNIRVETPLENGLSREMVNSSSINLTLVLVILASAAMLLILGIVVVASILVCRKRPEVVMRRRSSRPPDELELSEAGFNEGFHRRSAQYRASVYNTELDRELDVTLNSQKPQGPDLILSPVSFTQQNAQY
ncbi:B-cell receptor CD22 [Atheta coriaria]|uniref:B-cell receptor CD22 n=1 Tax=Dalotia coriaria TaxID=877792 RepID=UPI0031F340A5